MLQHLAHGVKDYFKSLTLSNTDACKWLALILTAFEPQTPFLFPISVFSGLIKPN